MKPNIISRYGILIGAVLVGIIFRFWSGMHQPVFSDEAYSIYESQFYPFPYDPSYPPLYPIFLHYWVKISTDLLWVRLPSIIAGTLSLVVVWRMLEKHINLHAANIGVALLSLSSLHIHYSWVARPHALTAYIVILSLEQLWNLSKTIELRTIPSDKRLALYLMTNSIGALLSHGYTMFLLGSLTALCIWTIQKNMWSRLWKTRLRAAVIVLLHTLLPFIQFIFIGNELKPLIDSAVWIPNFSMHSVTSVFLTLFNGTKVLTGDLYSSTLIAVYTSLTVVCIMIHALYKTLRTSAPFIALLFMCSIGASLVAVAIVYSWLGMTILQPRLLLSIHILYILGLSVTIPAVIRNARKKYFFRSAYFYESIVLILFLVFNVRSLVLLNIEDYYMSRHVLSVINQLKSDQHSALIVFPRYHVLTIQYLWGLYTTHPALASAHSLLAIGDNQHISQYLESLPLHQPITMLILEDPSTLSSGAQEIIKRLTPLCKRGTIQAADILHCPPLIHKP